MQTLQTVKTAPNVPIMGGGGGKWLKNVKIPNLKPGSDIRTFLKRTEYQRKKVTPETEGNVPSNAIKLDLIAVD